MESGVIMRKKFTIGSLILQSIVLLAFASVFFYMYISQGLYPSGLAFTPTAYFLVMGLLSIWLASRHYLRTIKKQNLMIWATLHIFVSLYIFFTILYLSSMHASLPPNSLIYSLFPLIFYIIPPVFVLVSVLKEQT